ncbi:A24 family peptidase [Rhodoferax sp. OV413]|uniref:prepilin peptidase n=1 Tax=Rhodoferax sp. OV413 TaxID=1855285 RepID=UPI0025D4547C|nr:A24 family peptidase [Rhodoferax sp. OV413]
MGAALPWLDASLWACVGLLIGSFLNVVIHRLPRMMEREWAAECAELQINEAQGKDASPLDESPPFNLLVPRSRCPDCGHLIAWYENIPLLSYAFLRGRCSECGKRISWRYPAVELATGALFFFCAWTFGPTPEALAWSVFSAALLALACIDWDTTLLPDNITQPLLWLGLIAAALQWTPVTLPTALWGAVGGYLSLWSVYWLFKLVTGKEGMGFGDFKLFAALGAWFGWPVLIPMVLMASVIGAILGIAMKFTTGLREGGYVPFGPFLAGAGFAALLLGPEDLRRLLSF